jgi:hypothetical protein
MDTGTAMIRTLFATTLAAAIWLAAPAPPAAAASCSTGWHLGDPPCSWVPGPPPTTAAECAAHYAAGPGPGRIICGSPRFAPK